MRRRIPQASQVVHPSSVAFRSIERVTSPALKVRHPVPTESRARLPIQGAPVNRSEVPRPFMVDYGPFRAIPEADPQPDIHAYFSSQVDSRLGICPVLSGYAIVRCFQTGGLF